VPSAFILPSRRHHLGDGFGMTHGFGQRATRMRDRVIGKNAVYATPAIPDCFAGASTFVVEVIAVTAVSGITRGAFEGMQQ